MKHYIFYLIFLIPVLIPAGNLYAQQGTGLSISGTVMTEQGGPLPGVNVYVKNTTTGAITDPEGRFVLKNIPKDSTAVFSFIGYDNYEMKVERTKERLKIVMKPRVNELDEAVVVGHGTQRKITTTGAISTISTEELQVPATSVSNMLAGRVAGVIGVQRSGEPGSDYSEFWIRGISTFGANSSALILIDGVEGDLDNIDPMDIESFSILKDASATAVYGNRGANGVVLVTTKRGKAGKLNIQVKANRTLSFSERLPDYVNALTYASLANEALVVRGKESTYSETDLELFRNGLDPDLHPDISWRDIILKDYTWMSQYNLNISGGGTAARYYLSVGYQNQQGIFKQDESANKYNVNCDYNQYNFRANVDASLTPSTELSLNIDDVISTKNIPGYDNNDAIWSAQANLTPVTCPVRYSNGQLAAYGDDGSQITPYVLLNKTGYKRTGNNTVNVKLNLNQKLDFFTKGLSINGLFSYKYYGEHISKRYKMPALYYASGRQNDGTLITTKTVSAEDATYSQSAYIDRLSYGEVKLDYNRTFDEDHHVSGLLLGYLQDERNSSGSDYDDVIPVRYEDLSFRGTYSYKDTYLLEANLGFSGSMDFASGEQFGLFPAFSLGWVPTQYGWTKKHVPFVSYFKLRASWGQVGNGDLSERFPYLSLMTSGSNDWGSTTTEDKVGVNNLKWEVATKYDVGVDAKFWKDRFDLTVDGFLTYDDNIYQQRSTIPEEVGAAQNPWTNAGSMKSWGADGNLSYNQVFSKDLELTIRGNFTWARNKVTHWEQTGINYPYQAYAGYRYGIQRGLIDLGLFKDQADIDNSPTQTFMSNYLPGDIKYKDVNGDGIIDEEDEVPLKSSDDPELEYGLALELRVKRWTFEVYFTGQYRASYFLGGTGYYPFSGEEEGNVLTLVADQKNRWTPASYSGTTDTENPDARFPRLTYGDNANNNQNSTFWLADASFLRLKTAEVAYRFDGRWMREHGISSASLSLIGTNLACWDKVKLWDPEQASSNGSVYPIQTKFTLQLLMTF